MSPETAYKLTELLERLKKLKWLPIRHWFDLRQVMKLSARVRDPTDGERYRFTCSSLHSYQRARDPLGKEPGTIAWLRKNLRPSDVFLDIGANIGTRSEEHTSELQSLRHLVCRLLLERKKGDR